jgi:hypothetical protein
VFFTPGQAALVTLIAEQIVPKDQDPGATDAAVVYYIDRQLAGPLYRELLSAFEPMRETTIPCKASTALLRTGQSR